jgi:ESCRT-II complex subunit VPS22
VVFRERKESEGVSRMRGRAALQRRKRLRKRKQDLGEEVTKDRMAQMEKQLGEFKVKLEEFAGKYRERINKDPEFRRQFQIMTSSVGVDPLASSKGFWAQILGVGDYYYELGVQIVDACLATRGLNGGVMDVRVLQGRLSSSRSSRAAAPTLDDIERAVKTLKSLGSGFCIKNIGGIAYVVSVPLELSTDQTKVLDLASKGGKHSVGTAASASAAAASSGAGSGAGEWVLVGGSVSGGSGGTGVKGCVFESQLRFELGWSKRRAGDTLAQLLREGMAWVDDQSEGGERAYWFPAVALSV